MDLRGREKHRTGRQEICSLLDKHGPKAPVETDFFYRFKPKPCARNIRNWQRLLVEWHYAIRNVSKKYGSFGMETVILESQIIADLIDLYFWNKQVGFNCAQLARSERLRASSIENMWRQTSSL